MNIGIDGYEANVANKVGIGRYAFELIWALYRLETMDSFTIFLPKKKMSDFPPERKRWRYCIIDSSFFWTYYRLPQALRHEQLDVFFSPTHYIPLFTSIPRVFSIMDLSYIHFPSMFRAKDLIQLQVGTRYSVKAAKRIITISNFSKNAIIKQYGISESKITVTYPGFNRSLFNIDIAQKSIQAIQSKYKIAEDYIVYIGTLQPRKNIVRLVDAFSNMEKRKVKLFIVGKKGWLYKEMFNKIKENKLTERIIFTDFVPDVDLASLLAGSMCFVLPSLYEGFGIPAVEALACGVPVVVSNTSSLPEVVGEAGILVDPLDVKSIQTGIEKAISLSPKKRDTIVHNGLQHIKQFDWCICAKKTLQTLKEAAV